MRNKMYQQGSLSPFSSLIVCLKVRFPWRFHFTVWIYRFQYHSFSVLLPLARLFLVPSWLCLLSPAAVFSDSPPMAGESKQTGRTETMLINWSLTSRGRPWRCEQLPTHLRLAISLTGLLMTNQRREWLHRLLTRRIYDCTLVCLYRWGLYSDNRVWALVRQRKKGTSE